MVCFINALDECKEVLELVRFFEDIREAAVLSGSYLQICLLTRHYPNIPIRRGIEFTLEKQHGQNQDIITYIKNEFIAPHNSHMDYIKAGLYRRSSNVFLWVVLVVDLLNKAYLRGIVQPVLLQQLLVSFPEELHDLFSRILETDPNSKRESVLCIQWLVFAREPLTPLELYFAVMSGTEPKTLEVWDESDISYQDTCNFILNISKGLAEVSKSDGSVNLIHESVRDYFLFNDGLTKFQPDFATNMEGFSEMALKQCCHQYVLFAIFDAGAGISEDKDKDERSEEDEGGEEVEESDTSYEYEDEQSDTSSEYEDEESGREDEAIAKLGSQSDDGRLRLGFITRFPFARYAVRNLFRHAKATQSCGIDQSEFLMEFECPDKMLLEKWIELYNIVQQTWRNDHLKHESGRYNPDTELLYIFSDQNLPRLVRILIMKGIDVKAACKTYDNPLLTASRNGYLTVVQLLITAGAVPNTNEADNLGRTNPPELCVAAAKGHLEIVQLLLKSGANVNCDGGPIGSPLHAAATYATSSAGQLKIIKLLLASGAKVNCKSGIYGSALQGAASRGSLEIVQVLLKSGADVNSEDGNVGSALQAAALGRGKLEILQLLLKSGADVNSKGGNSGSALQAAALSRGRLDIVQLLLESGADVNINGGIFGSALQMAAASGDPEKVQLLLESGAHVNYEGGRYGSALRAAIAKGRQNIVIILRRHGAKDSNTQDPSPSI